MRFYYSEGLFPVNFKKFSQIYFYPFNGSLHFYLKVFLTNAQLFSCSLKLSAAGVYQGL